MTNECKKKSSLPDNTLTIKSRKNNLKSNKRSTMTTRSSSRIKNKLSPQKITLTNNCTLQTSLKSSKKELNKTEPTTTTTVESKKMTDYRCNICNIVVKRKFDLKFHMRFVHNFDDLSSECYSCDNCSYRCRRKCDIRRHITKVHHNANELTCVICEQKFSLKVELRKHVFSSHFPHATKSGERWHRGYCCDICHEGFASQKNLLSHRSILHSDCPPLTYTYFRSCLAKLKACDKCDKHFKDGIHYDEHVCVKLEDTDVILRLKESLQAKPKYKCDICSMCFQWKWIYRLHRENIHSNAADILNWDAIRPTIIEHYCLSCSHVFQNETQVDKHRCIFGDIKDVKKEKAFICNLCGNNYCRKSDYWRHRRYKHKDYTGDGLGNNENSSNSSSGGTSNSNAIRRKTSIKCPYCDIETATRNGILVHIKEAHNIDTDSPFVCVPCNKVFKRKATMDTHNQVYHPKEENIEETNKILREAEILLNGEQAYHCNICNRNMFNAFRFVAHYRLHNVERKYTCDLCGKQTRTQHQLNSHIKIIHLNIRNFECDICQKCFYSKQTCEEHRRIHTGERPFSCEICGKTFIAMNALFTHKKFHNDFYAHPCHLCDKKFKVRRSLINHIRTHTGERPFKCELCPKTFNNSSRFSYHKKVTHSDNRPFSCQQCGSCFKANKFLMRHMKLHKTRTHIQFRRRNNPAYFAIHDSNNSKCSSQKKKNSSASDKQLNDSTSNISNNSNNLVIMEDSRNEVPESLKSENVYDFQKRTLTFDDQNEDIAFNNSQSNNLSNNETFIDEDLVQTSPEITFEVVPVTNKRSRGLSNNQHITCL